MITYRGDSVAINYLSRRDWRLSRLIEYLGELEERPRPSAFESVCHSIIEQMMSAKSARTIENRLRASCGGEITRARVAEMTVEQLRSVGLSLRKSTCLKSFADSIDDGFLDSLSELSQEEVVKILCSFPGIGKWTADMFLLFT